MYEALNLLNKDQSKNACNPQVVAKVVELALLNKGHEPLQSDDAEDKGNDHTHQKFRSKLAGFCASLSLFGIFQDILGDLFGILALEPLDYIKESRTSHSRNAHKEAEFASILAVHSQEDHATDGRAAAANTRDASDTLNHASDQGAPPVHTDAFVVRMLAASFAPLGNEQQCCSKQHCAANGLGIFEQAFKRFLEANTDDGRRDGCENDIAHFVQLSPVAVDAAHDHVHDFLAEHHKDGKQRARVEHDVEEHSGFVHVQQLFAKNKMTGTGNGKKFCEALQKAQNDRLNHKRKYSFYYFVNMAAKKFLLCFHDFSVWNYQTIMPVLEGIKDLAGGPFSILVIPSTEGADEATVAGFKASLRQLYNEGYELALHGYKHKADFSQGRSYLGLAAMSITNREAEFAGLSQFESERILNQGLSAWVDLFKVSNNEDTSATPRPAAFIPPTWWSNKFLQLQVCGAGMLYEDRFSLTTRKGKRYASPVTSFAGIPNFAIKPMFSIGEFLMKVPFGLPRIALHPTDFPTHRAKIKHMIRTALGSGRTLVHYRDI